MRSSSSAIACTLLLILLGVLAPLPLQAAPEEARFMTSVDIHGDMIVFSFEGDLWRVPAAGGEATRLTSFPAEENYPRFSPDGRWIAFVGSYDGPAAVYRIPAAGGEPQRLSWQPDLDRTIEWTPDGKRVIFSTFVEKTIQRDPVLYSAGLDGAAPERLPIDRGSFCSFSPDGRQIAYNRRTFAPSNWKRYKGGRHADVWLYDFASRKFTPITADFEGPCAMPLWIGGRIFYVSERFNGGIANLCAYSVETRSTAPVTAFKDFPVTEPATDGRRIVFLQNGYLHLLDPASSQAPVRLTVSVSSDHWQMRDRLIDPRGHIRATNVANSGKTVILEARGDLFALPAGNGQVRNLSNDCGSRELLPRLSPDGRQVAFFSDRSGEYQLYLQPAAGGAWTTLTTTLDRYPDRLEWSPDGKKLLFGSRRVSIHVLDVATQKLTLVDEVTRDSAASAWEVGDATWAPDSNWIAYTGQAANDNGRIFLYSLASGKRYPVTGDFYNNSDPCFDHNGEYLYYLSSRNFSVRTDLYRDNHIITNPFQVMAVQLRDGQKPPFAEKDDEEDAEKKPAPARAASTIQRGLRALAQLGATTATTTTTRAATRPTTATTPLRIDLGGFARRTFPLPVAAGEYSSLAAARGRVLWLGRTEGGSEEDARNRLHIFDMKERKDAVVEDSVRGFSLSVSGEQIIVSLSNPTGTTSYAVSTVDKLRQSRRAGERLNLSGMVYRLDTVREWNQIFSDAWRWYREYFWDAGMHGRDWKAIGEHYRAMIPTLTSRARLNWVLQEMVGELCASHSYVQGGDMNDLATPQPPVFTGRLGADLAWDTSATCYRFARIYGPTDFNLDLKSPLVRPDFKLKEGDWLLAIDGRPLRDRADVHQLLQVTRGQKVKLTVNDRPTTAGARTYAIEPLSSERDLRYYRWVSDNIAAVSRASGGRIGYMHFRDMSANTIAEFDKFWRAYHDKDGVIIDVRGNSGGNTDSFLIDKMERRRVATFVKRDSAQIHYPYAAGELRYAALTNHDNYSCGETFLEHFKARGLGKVIGTNSGGGGIWIYPPLTTVDGGRINQPNLGYFGKDGKWLVENHGVDPHIELDNDPASVLAGRDLQLEKAIAVLQEEIAQTRKDGKDDFPPRPEYPKR